MRGRRGARGVKGAAGLEGSQGERGERGPDLNEGRSYWFQVGVIPRWQLVVLWLSMGAIAAIGGGIAISQSNAIQENRVQVTRDACRAQNERHDAAVAKTLELLARPSAQTRDLTPEQKKVQRDTTIEWVDTLVPRRDCEAQVKAIESG